MKSFFRQALPIQQEDDCMSVMCQYMSWLQGKGGALEAPIDQATLLEFRP